MGAASHGPVLWDRIMRQLIIAIVIAELIEHIVEWIFGIIRRKLGKVFNK